jgi:AP-5 complex subunit beta-1
MILLLGWCYLSLDFLLTALNDSSRICLRLLSCVPGKKLRHLMVLGEQPSTPSRPGSLFDLPSPRPSQDNKSMPNLKSYIHLERVVPLVVKQSWALTLPNFCIQSRATGCILSIQDVSPTNPEDEKPPQPTVERIGYTHEALRVMDSKGAETLQILRGYFSCIPDYMHSTGFKIIIQCTFRFDSEPFSRAYGADSSVSGSDGVDELPALYAVTIAFSSSAQYGNIPSCHVPFILGEPPGSGMDIVPLDDQNRGESNYCASVTIELEPREPSPGLIDVSVAANTENCQVISGPLQPITVGIEDMFLKASVPPDTPKETVANYYQDLFHALWEACNSSSNTGRETYPLSGGKGSVAVNGTRSVKLMELTPKVLITAVEKYLAPFVVSVVGDSLITILRGNGVIKDIVWEESVSDATVGVDALVPYSPDNNLQLELIDDDGIRVDAERYGHQSKRDMGVVCVMIFLPPRYHLLFLMEVGCASTLVRIRTDHWPCLAYVDEYLEALVC